MRAKSVIVTLLIIAIPALPLALVVDRATHGGVARSAGHVLSWGAGMAARSGLTGWVNDKLAQDDSIPADDTWRTGAMKEAGEVLGNAAGGTNKAEALENAANP